MTWSEFVAEVKKHLGVDGTREGAADLLNLQIIAAVLDLQAKIPSYTKRHEFTYKPIDFVQIGKASRTAAVNGRIIEATIIRYKVGDAITGTVQAGAITVTGTDTTFTDDLEVGDLVVSGEAPVWENATRVQRLVSDTEVWLANAIGSGDAGDTLCVVEYQENPCRLVDFSLLSMLTGGEACINDGSGLLTVSPARDYMYVYPNIIYDEDDLGWEYRFKIAYSGIRQAWGENDTVPFGQDTADVVADWVKGEIARQLEDNLQKWATYLEPAKGPGQMGGSYFQKRARLMRTESQRFTG